MNDRTRETPMVSLKSKESKVEPTIRRAIEITEKEGYSVREWMWALNLEVRENPERLRRTSQILTALVTAKSS